MLTRAHSRRLEGLHREIAEVYQDAVYTSATVPRVEYNDLVDLHRRQDRPYLVLFGAPWCPACATLLERLEAHAETTGEACYSHNLIEAAGAGLYLYPPPAPAPASDTGIYKHKIPLVVRFGPDGSEIARAYGADADLISMSAAG